MSKYFIQRGGGGGGGRNWRQSARARGERILLNSNAFLRDYFNLGRFLPFRPFFAAFAFFLSFARLSLPFFYKSLREGGRWLGGIVCMQII